VSHERIYPYIWEDKRNKGNLHLHLRNKGRRYRKRGSAKDSRGIIRNRVDISERGANENLKRLIRQSFPKGCDFEKITPKQIAKVKIILNNRLEKRFNFDTPYKKFEQLTYIKPVALVN